MDGQSLSQKIAQNCAEQLAALNHPTITLATVLIGDYAPQSSLCKLEDASRQKSRLNTAFS